MQEHSRVFHVGRATSNKTGPQIGSESPRGPGGNGKGSVEAEPVNRQATIEGATLHTPRSQRVARLCYPNGVGTNSPGNTGVHRDVGASTNHTYTPAGRPEPTMPRDRGTRVGAGVQQCPRHCVDGFPYSTTHQTIVGKGTEGPIRRHTPKGSPI